MHFQLERRRLEEDKQSAKRSKDKESREHEMNFRERRAGQLESEFITLHQAFSAARLFFRGQEGYADDSSYKPWSLRNQGIEDEAGSVVSGATRSVMTSRVGEGSGV